MTPTPSEISERSQGLIEPVKKCPKKEILIDGTIYDVTDWIKKHPGGRVINYYTESGEDASIPFQQFHNRSAKKVLAIANSLSHRVANEDEMGLDPSALKRHKSLTEGFKMLHEEFVAEGLYNPSLSHVIGRVVEFFIYLVLSMVILHRDSVELPLRAVGILCLATAFGRVVWMAHEAGHYSLTGSPRVDIVLMGFLYGFGNGLSGTWWNHNHSKHHAMPQRIKRDIDLDTLPLLAFTTKGCKNLKEGQNFFIKYQSILFLPFHTFLVSLRWMFSLHPRFCYYKSNYFELTCMALHYLIIIQVGFVNFLIAKWLWSLYMFGNFSLSHTHTGVIEEPRHWAEYALSHTINIESNWFIDWLMGFLNYQIEHHLFPTMPQFRHGLIKDRVRKYAEENGLPYRVLTYYEAVRTTLANLHDVANEFHNHSSE